LHPVEFGSFVAIVNRPETAGRWRVAPAGMTEGSSVTAIQLSPRRRRVVKGTWPRRSPNVGNLIGYSYRKLGDYKFSQVLYECALKADPTMY
jgi:hypothetical protein